MRRFVREPNDFLVKFVHAVYPRRMTVRTFLCAVVGAKWNKTLGKPQVTVRRIKAELLQTPSFCRR